MSKDIWEKESCMEPQAEKIGQRLTAAHQNLPAEARELSLGHEPGLMESGCLSLGQVTAH